ncbi:MAG: M20 family metallopeptidase [Eubacteriales bacterium]|nr:M20 family metallopeptidase [Eubacteriales bacterium]
MAEDKQITELIKKGAEKYSDAMVEFRRDLHAHPELSNEERRTAERIAEELGKLDGIEVIRGLAGGTGVAGILHGTKERNTDVAEDKVVLLRADIDALPIEEKTGLPFSSCTPGVMHACGHDGHASWLLGSAMILSELRDRFAGTVKFVFQPAEEGGGGGKRMAEESRILENPKVDAVFAAHAWPEIDAGELHIAARSAFGFPGWFSIKVTGKSGHGSWPHQCVDPIAVANQIYGALQQIVSRRLDETAARVLSVCTIHSGPQDKSNIIPDCCTMTGTIRSDRREEMEKMKKMIREVSETIAAANGATAEVSADYTEAVINTPEAVTFCEAEAVKILGRENVKIDNNPHLGGEDFAEYITRVPGAYVFAGIATDETRGKFGLHSDNLILEESVLPKVAAVFAQFAVGYLEKGRF